MYASSFLFLVIKAVFIRITNIIFWISDLTVFNIKNSKNMCVNISKIGLV